MPAYGETYEQRKGWYLRMIGAAKARARIKRMTQEFGSELPNIFVRGGTKIQKTAQKKITEKGHVVTGNLRRSLNTQVTDYSTDRVKVAVGTWVAYAPKIENLPDGGFLFEAFDEERAEVLRYIRNRLDAVIRRNTGR